MQDDPPDCERPPERYSQILPLTNGARNLLKQPQPLKLRGEALFALTQSKCCRPFDPSENIRAGTQYLKELMELFGGRVDLALAGYNAGEGAVVRFGGAVPPFRETQDYVKRISKRYVLSKPSDVKREGASKLPGVQ